MAENRLPMRIDVHVHILPLLDLCRFAAMASTAITELNCLAGIRPEFRRDLHAGASDFAELADYGGGSMAAAGIAIAMDLLREYDESPGVSVQPVAADEMRS